MAGEHLARRLRGRSSSGPVGRVSAAVLAALLLACGTPPAELVDDEAVTAERFDQLRGEPEQLGAFLREMPLGGDLHHHANGGVRPSVLVEFAAQDGLCLPGDPAVAWVLEAPPCGPGSRPATDALADPALRREIEHRWSMADFLADDPAIDRPAANDHFFRTFAMTELARADFGRLVAAVRSLAADAGVLYLETSIGIDPDPAAVVVLRSETTFDDDLRALHATLIASPHLQAARDASVAALARGLDRSEDLLDCAGARPAPGCTVLVRTKRLLLRMNDPAAVFADMVLSYEIARASPLVVGVDFAGPETHPVSVRDYHLHMRMFGLMAQLYPDVPLALHAGEMTPAVAAQLDAADHLRLAIGPTPDGAGARRIGHAVALEADADVDSLLAQMRQRGIAVEINLESNRLLLGTRPRDHPLVRFLGASVPIVLSTDDPGPMLTDLTRQFELAASNPEVGYTQLKEAVLNSIDYSFLPPVDKEPLRARLIEGLARFEAAVAGR